MEITVHMMHHFSRRPALKPPRTGDGNDAAAAEKEAGLEAQAFSSNGAVLIRQLPGVLNLVLNRPEAINSITLDMVRSMAGELEKARGNEDVRLVLFRGEGEKGFCAGGDIKIMARASQENDMAPAMQFLKEENDLDLAIHDYPRPVVVIAHGITMGGGLGIAAGADIVVATETTRMAMPETRIGFFPDVGATRWLFSRCGKGYPEFLGLTGYELKGAECVRVGLASCLIPSSRLEEAVAALISRAPSLASERKEAAAEIREILKPIASSDIPADPEMDRWVEEHFAGKKSVTGILSKLRACSTLNDLCEGVFERLSERSPTAVVVTLECLRRDEERALKDVYRSDLDVARYLMSQHDFREGVRARLIDRDNRPQWDPDTFERAAATVHLAHIDW